ncbi:hypothetical protein [Pseudodesulfovibrio sediminis]|uniref:hypothetical protein n=1 Tax=Pseudodesulfovibrio sediminis TaxID=2810563 RepID=UPI001E58AF84|nr:hypothetical protein [Pseudodesulfovibrio sediminis]
MPIQILITDSYNESCSWSREYCNIALPHLHTLLSHIPHEHTVNFLATSVKSQKILTDLGLPFLSVIGCVGKGSTIKAAAQQLGAEDDIFVLLSGFAPHISPSSIEEGISLLKDAPDTLITSCVEPSDHPCQFRKFHIIENVKPLPEEALDRKKNRVCQTVLEQNQHGVATLLATTSHGFERLDAPITNGVLKTTLPFNLEPHSTLHCIIKKEIHGGQYHAENHYEPECGLWSRDNAKCLTLDHNGKKIWGRQAFPQVFKKTEHIKIGRLEALLHQDRTNSRGVVLHEEEALLVQNSIDILRMDILDERRVNE